MLRLLPLNWKTGGGRVNILFSSNSHKCYPPRLSSLRSYKLSYICKPGVKSVCVERCFQTNLVMHSPGSIRPSRHYATPVSRHALIMTCLQTIEGKICPFNSIFNCEWRTPTTFVLQITRMKVLAWQWYGTCELSGKKCLFFLRAVYGCVSGLSFICSPMHLLPLLK